MNTLWLIIGLVVGVLFLIAIIPEVYMRFARKREKRLNHRHKRRIRL